MNKDLTTDFNDTFSEMKVTRGDGLMLYSKTGQSYTIRIHVKLDQPIDPDKLRIALDKTAARYPYFCVSLKKNDKEYYYEKNEAPVALIHTSKAVALNTEETNGHIWAVCYEGDSLFIDIYHGITDGTGAYYLTETLLYYYLIQSYDIPDCPGLRTLELPITEKEVRDPLDALPSIDLTTLKLPPTPHALNLMQASGLQRMEGKGIVLKLIIPEEAFIAFSKENDATPGIMLSVLWARAIRRVHPDLPDSIIASYVANARPALGAGETFHNCVSTVSLEYCSRVQRMPLVKQCTVFRGKTFLQADEERLQKVMVVTGSLSKMILDLPDLNTKIQTANKMMAGAFTGTSFMVSYVGKWEFPQLGKYVREFWLETPVSVNPVIELSAVNGQLFLAIMQPFAEKIYYEALLQELKDYEIPYKELGEEENCIADILM